MVNIVNIDKMEDIKKQYKRTALELAKHHKKHCDGDCNISLWFLKNMAEELGIKFNDKEKQEFI